MTNNLFFSVLIVVMTVFDSVSQVWTKYTPDIESVENIQYLEIKGIRNINFPDLTVFESLKGLYINGVYGEIENTINLESLKKLSNLKVVGVDFKSPNDIFLQISKLKALDTLYLSTINIDTLIPQELLNLKMLTYLKLELISTPLNKTINFELISNLKSLEYLDIQGNFLNTFEGDFNMFIDHPTIRVIRIDGNCLDKSYLKMLINKCSTIQIINEINC